VSASSLNRSVFTCAKVEIHKNDIAIVKERKFFFILSSEFDFLIWYELNKISAFLN
jgi:hypothetical protein